MMYVCSCHPCFGPSAANILPIFQLVSFCYIFCWIDIVVVVASISRF